MTSEKKKNNMPAYNFGLFLCYIDTHTRIHTYIDTVRIVRVYVTERTPRRRVMRPTNLIIIIYIIIVYSAVKTWADNIISLFLLFLCVSAAADPAVRLPPRFLLVTWRILYIIYARRRKYALSVVTNSTTRTATVTSQGRETE